MINYLFSDIPRMLFEPIAVCAIAGGIFAFFSNPQKKHHRFFQIIIVLFLFMLCWRLACASVMLSPRYASIFLYFAVIASVWFCFSIKKVMKRILSIFPKLSHLRFSSKLCYALSFLLLGGLAISSLCKTLRFDPYGAHAVKLGKFLAEEVRGKDFLLYTQNIQNDRERISYYSGIETKKIRVFEAPNLSLCESMKTKMEESKNFFSLLYFIIYVKKGDPEPDADCLGITSDFGKLECLHREYTSHKKNKEVVLYRFTPAHSNIELWNKSIPEISSHSLCKNGDCEEFLSGKGLEERINYYRKIGASDFYLTTGRIFPTAWWFGVAKNVDGVFSSMALTEKNPIAGKFSLEMNSVNNVAWGMNSNFIPKQDCIFSGFLRAEDDATVRVYSCYYDEEKKETRFISTNLFQLSPGNTYRFSFPVHKSDVPDEDKNIYLMIHGTGHVLMDNVEFIPMEKDPLKK